MKKSQLINSDISYLIATLGHKDEITICDAGLPIADETQRIDLALTQGVPTFIDTVKVVLSELQIEGVVIATEFKEVSPALHQSLLEILKEEERICGKAITISYVEHETFKQKTHSSKAAIRTGEYTPYANVIFQTGVVF